MNMQDLIQISPAGIITADFSTIRETLIDNYKSVYGVDIDLSTGTADGIFINNVALLINNIFETIQIAYANLDVSSATGVYLDALCNLSNVTRKAATNSSATLTLKNTATNASTLASNTKFFDNAGTIWIYTGKDISISAGGSQDIVVTCETSGRISAPAGWIDRTVLISPFTVTQSQAAKMGSERETDQSLRRRRAQSNGAHGATTLESLVGALLQLSGIDDVKIYNNNSETPYATAKDSTQVLFHNVYIILRQRENIEIDDDTIGEIIHNGMTPGIATQQSAVSADSKSYTFIPTVNGTKVEGFSEVVYWKKATPIHPTITITITALDNFTSSYAETAGYRVIKYLNELQLSTELDTNNILAEMLYSDPTLKGRPTYICNSVALATSHANTDTYFDYNKITVAAVSGQTGKYTVTLSKQ